METLGAGTAYRAALHPEDRWTERDYLIHDIDDFARCAVYQHVPDTVDKPLMPRPGDAERAARAQREAVEKARAIHDYIKRTKWQEVPKDG